MRQKTDAFAFGTIRPQVQVLSLRQYRVFKTDLTIVNTPTRKSLWSSTPHRDFSIECYKVAKKTPDGIDYEITIDGKNGYATVAMTKYYDGTEEPTLPINLGTHSIYFYAE